MLPAVIERRAFGRTGHLSTATVFGWAALARASQAEADRALDLLLQHGVNHIDTAAQYGDSELRDSLSIFPRTRRGSGSSPRTRFTSTGSFRSLQRKGCSA